MIEKNKWIIKPGNPLLIGTNKMPNGYHFAVEALLGSKVSLVLYKKGLNVPLCEIPFPEAGRKGAIYSMEIEGFHVGELEYNYSIDGNITQDPYAFGISGRKKFGEDYSDNPHDIRCRFLNEEEYNWNGDEAPKLFYHEMILYKLHVRGYTMLAEISQKKRGTFSGLMEMIPYWQELGINAIELMPMYEFQEVTSGKETKYLVSNKYSQEKINFWGYIPGFYFAPKDSYCATNDPETEVKDFIKALHSANMECIMEVFVPEDINYDMLQKILRFWNIHYHVDGFHLTGKNVPIAWIKKDPVLADVKLIFNGTEMQDDYCISIEKRRIACYNEEFLYNMRRFLKSDAGMLPSVMEHIKCNWDTCGVINAITTQDGMTLNDLVSYTWKHNEDNGENNKDGRTDDCSWNCGTEGNSQSQDICLLRDRQVKNAVLLMLLSQGTPMLYGGDEFLNTQNGNNNAYCQDNPVGWVNWDVKNKSEFFRFVKKTIAFRKEHPVFHQAESYKSSDYLCKGFPDISFHGEKSWHFKMEQESRYMGVMYNGSYGQKKDGIEDDYFYIGYNFHWEKNYIFLPKLPFGKKWKVMADTYDGYSEPFFVEREKDCGKVIEIGPRTIMILIGK